MAESFVFKPKAKNKKPKAEEEKPKVSEVTLALCACAEAIGAAALGGLYTGWLSVQASLRIKFACAGSDRTPHASAATECGIHWLQLRQIARSQPRSASRTITLALSCAEMLEYYAIKALLPIATPLVAPEVPTPWLQPSSYPAD